MPQRYVMWRTYGAMQRHASVMRHDFQVLRDAYVDAAPARCDASERMSFFFHDGYARLPPSLVLCALRPAQRCASACVLYVAGAKAPPLTRRGPLFAHTPASRAADIAGAPGAVRACARRDVAFALFARRRTTRRSAFSEMAFIFAMLCAARHGAGAGAAAYHLELSFDI